MSPLIKTESPYLSSFPAWSGRVPTLSPGATTAAPGGPHPGETEVPTRTEDLLEADFQATSHSSPGPSVDVVRSPHAVPIQEFGAALGELAAPHDATSITKALVRRPVDSTQEFLLSGQNAATQLDAHAPRHFPGFGLLAGALLASSIFGALVPAAHAAEPQPPSGVSQATPAAANLSSLAHSYGLKTDVLQKLTDQDVTQVLESLPSTAKSAYKQLTEQHKQLFFNKLQGSTNVLFVTVNNKDAFIKGSVAGFDTFDQMQKKLDESVASGKIDAKLQSSLTTCIQMFRQMTPTQREAVVQLLQVDLGHTLN